MTSLLLFHHYTIVAPGRVENNLVRGGGIKIACHRDLLGCVWNAINNFVIVITIILIQNGIFSVNVTKGNKSNQFYFLNICMPLRSTMILFNVCFFFPNFEVYK